MSAITDVLVDRRGNSIGGVVRFRGHCDHSPSLDEVSEAQGKAGYHPLGYGGPNNVRSEPDGEGFVVTWTCYASAD